MISLNLTNVVTIALISVAAYAAAKAAAKAVTKQTGYDLSWV